MKRILIVSIIFLIGCASTNPQGYTVKNYSAGPVPGPSPAIAPSSFVSRLLSAFKGVAKAYEDSAPQRAVRRQQWHNFNVRREMRAQTSIMQQSLDVQRSAPRTIIKHPY